MAAAAWGDDPFAHTEARGAPPPSLADATEPVTGGGVTLSVPLAMLEELDSLSDVLSLDTCAALLLCAARLPFVRCLR
jgi:hypothetical protein